MNIWIYLVERLSEISTIGLHIYFLYSTLNAKVGVRKQVLAGTIFICVRMVYFILGGRERPYFAVITGIIYAAFVFFGDFKAYVVWNIILIILDGIVDAVIISLYLLLPNSFCENIYLPGLPRINFIIAAKFTLFAVYYFVTRKIDKSNSIRWNDCISLTLIPIGEWLLLEIIFQYSDMLPDKKSSLILVMGSIVLLLMMASVIILYSRITTDGIKLAQSKLQLCTAELTQDHIQQINDVYSKLSTLRHDLNSHFSALSGYLKVKDYEGMEQYIEKLVDFEIRPQEYCKHPVLNALISSKVEMASDSNIDFAINIEMPKTLPISDVDLCILMSNVLNNAFEASEQVAGSRFINLSTRIIDSYWVVACQNSTSREDRFRAFGSIKSTKSTAYMHGIGTQQIQKIAEKTGGFVTYRNENFEFTTLVMIKLAA